MRLWHSDNASISRAFSQQPCSDGAGEEDIFRNGQFYTKNTAGATAREACSLEWPTVDAMCAPHKVSTGNSATVKVDFDHSGLELWSLINSTLFAFSRLEKAPSTRLIGKCPGCIRSPLSYSDNGGGNIAAPQDVIECIRVEPASTPPLPI